MRVWRCTSLLLLLLMGGAAHALFDPTQPQDYIAPTISDAASGETVEVKAGYTLQYVLFSSDRQFAVINGHRVVRGDLVGDARVLSIGPGSVRIRTPEETQELRLGYTDIKKSQGRNTR